MKNQNTTTPNSQSNIENFRSFLKSDLEIEIRKRSLDFIKNEFELFSHPSVESTNVLSHFSSFVELIHRSYIA